MCSNNVARAAFPVLMFRFRSSRPRSVFDPGATLLARNRRVLDALFVDASWIDERPVLSRLLCEFMLSPLSVLRNRQASEAIAGRRWLAVMAYHVLFA